MSDVIEGSAESSATPETPTEAERPSRIHALRKFHSGFGHKRIAPKIGSRLRVAEEDRLLHTAIGRLTGGVSPAAIALAYFDWGSQLAMQPGRQRELCFSAVDKAAHLAAFAMRRLLDPDAALPADTQKIDPRFRAESWRHWPFDVYAETFLLSEEWWQQLTGSVQGVSQHHRDLLSFLTRQWTDMFSPTNFPWSNPDVLATTLRENGGNLVRGLANAMEDQARRCNHAKPVGAENFLPGETVAITPGQVIFRNRLMELIQYSPQTAQVYAEPVLIVPAWIMKYYILDLSPSNSVIKYLVEKGHTVFAISWINPLADDRDLGMDDYRELGIMEALAVVRNVVPRQRIHAVGYCLGGTLLALAAAAMARDEDDRLASVSLLAAQIDFEEAGELLLFIDEAQLSFLENMMSEQGYLDKGQLSAAFNLLRSKDLIWSRAIDEYMHGERQRMFDLMAWSADSTRLPFRMHSEYLRSLFLNNDLAEGRYLIDDEGIALSDIRAPIFAVATETDHIAPWRSVYKVHLYTDTDVTFVLTSGGHNAGIISEPGRYRRNYRMTCKDARQRYIHPQKWYYTAPQHKDSWWPAWQTWLGKHSSGMTAPPETGAAAAGIVPLEPAPGRYVHMN